MELDLNEIRKQIDEVDETMVALFEKRMKLCREVAEYKISHGKQVLDRQREKEKLERVTALASDSFNKLGVSELFTQMMAMSRKLQYGLLAAHGMEKKIDFTEVTALEKQDCRVVYQGVEGAYSHQAVRKIFGTEVETYHVKTFLEAMEEVRDGKADYAVLPIENSTAGTVNDVYDLLYEFDNTVVEQTDLLVRHALLGTKEASMEDIKVVYSHPQGLMQCNDFLEEHREWQRIAQANTAGSAKKIMEENDRTHAAIASAITAEIYGLKILQENINRNQENTTKFVVVGNQKIYTGNATKILMVFELAHESGTLYNILSHFIYNGINMTSIESRPIKDRAWEYRFFVEIEGTLREPAVVNAVTGIMEEADHVKIIGNY